MAIFTGKHLRWRLFLIQNVAKCFRAPILKNICERLHLKMSMMKLRKVKYFSQGILTLHKQTGFFNIHIRNKWKCISLCFYLMIGFLWSVYLRRYFFDVVRSKLQTINIYTRVHKKKIKSSRKEYVTRTCFKFWPMKNISRKL